MFGFNKRKNYFKDVRDELFTIFEILQIEKIINVLRLREKFDEEYPDQTEKFDFQELVFFTLWSIAERDEKKIYKSFDVRCGAFYIITRYVTDAHNSGLLNEMEFEYPEMYEALKLLWIFCGEGLSRDWKTYAHCIIAPSDGSPFK